VIVGGVGSSVQVAVLDAVEVLPQPSIAVNILVCDLLQVPLTASSDEVIVVVAHASVAVAVPNAEIIADEVGLQPNATFEYEPVKVGEVTSDVHKIVREAVAELPQASMAVNVLVCERAQTLLITEPSDEVIVDVAHASVAVAVPNAEVIADEVGLHPNETFE
jgi:hypothetical protein